MWSHCRTKMVRCCLGLRALLIDKEHVARSPHCFDLNTFPFNRAMSAIAAMRLLFISVVAAVASAKCYEPTVAHPSPDYDPNDALLKHAFAEINTAIISAASAPEFSTTSFSVEITSSKETLWSTHHTANERNTSRPDIPEVNGDALYRIASITKTFTVLGILYQEKAGNLSLDDPVNKYIKELKEDQKGTLPWKDITLRSLASQLSGIPRECAIPGPPLPMFRGCHTLEGTGVDF